MSKYFHDLDPAVWQGQGPAPSHVELRAGELLFTEGDFGDGVYVVVEGCLQAVVARDGGNELRLGEMRPGDIIGEVQALTGGQRTATVRASADSELVKLSPETFAELIAEHPEELEQITERARHRLNRSMLAEVLPPLLGPLDDQALDFLESQAEWTSLRRGARLFEQGDAGGDFYVVMTGRLAAVATDGDGQELVLGEIKRGEWLGEMALFTGEPRTTAVRATRDSLLLAFPKRSFEGLSARFPEMILNLAHLVIQRLSKSTPSISSVPATFGSAHCVAVVPADARVDAAELAERLAAALSAVGETLHLSGPRLEHLFGTGVASGEPRGDLAHRRLSAWLDEQEHHHRFLVYEADAKTSAWTRICLRQADEILALTDVDTIAETCGLERVLASSGDDDIAGRTTLVILHPDGRRRPRLTGRRLRALGLDRHHHLRRDRANEIERLARFLDGRAVGLALGGGGARGLAHIGVIRALDEAGIPIDMIGGTSMGAFIAAQYAIHGDTEAVVEMNREIFFRGKPQRDLTLPMLGLLSGRRAENVLLRAFRGIEIEDLWLNFFAVSANLTTARQVIHRSGAVSRILRTSMSVPGAVTPVKHGRDLLVDGGVLNNLPGDVMRRLCGGQVILVNVSPANDLAVTGVGKRLPSPWKILWRRINPFTDRIDVPNIFEVVTRASALASIEHAALARSAADLYIEPPVDGFGLFETTALESLVEIGYRHARSEIERWQATDG